MPRYQLTLAGEEKTTVDFDSGEDFYDLGQVIVFGSRSWQVAGVELAGEPAFTTGLICRLLPVAA